MSSSNQSLDSHIKHSQEVLFQLNEVSDNLDILISRYFNSNFRLDPSASIGLLGLEDKGIDSHEDVYSLPEVYFSAWGEQTIITPVLYKAMMIRSWEKVNL